MLKVSGGFSKSDLSYEKAPTVINRVIISEYTIFLFELSGSEFSYEYNHN